MENLFIQLEEVSRLAESIHQVNEQLAQILQNARELMMSLTNCWESLGANEIRSRFEGFSLRFEEEYRVIEEYVRFLRHTIESYDSLESTIHANANNF